MRTMVADAPEMSGVVARSLLRAKADIDPDPRRAKPCMPLAGYFGVRVLDCGDYARNASGDDRIGAWWRFAEMRAGLERHVERGAARRLAGPRQRLHLSVGTAACLRPAAADDDAVLDQHRADGRIGPGVPQTTPPECKRKLH